MSELRVVHTLLAGKKGPEEGKKKIMGIVSEALGPEAAGENGIIVYVSNLEEIKSAITKLIEDRVPRVAVSGGDGFASLFANSFCRIKAEMKREDYNPDLLFLSGGTGNAIAHCSRFKKPVDALKCFHSKNYSTEHLNMLEVSFNGRKELCHFVSFGADGEIITIYKSQKLKGIFGYILAVLRYSFSRKLYNPLFSRNDANYNLDIKKDGERIHQGRYEGGGVSSIPFVGYGFRPYPLAEKGKAHIRFVLFGAILMPTMFLLTKWNFLRRKNRFIFDFELNAPAVFDFSFDRELYVQISGDCVGKQPGVRVEYTKNSPLNLVKKSDA